MANGADGAGPSKRRTPTTHEDISWADRPFTLCDDVALTSTAPPPPPPPNPLVNGGFEAGPLSSWTASGAATPGSTASHPGTYAAQLGSTSPTNGGSPIAQAFTAPAGRRTTTLLERARGPP